MKVPNVMYTTNCIEIQNENTTANYPVLKKHVNRYFQFKPKAIEFQEKN